MSIDAMKRAVASLKPNQRIKFDRMEIRSLEPRFVLMSQIWPVPDRVLGDIMGSAYEWFYDTDPMTGDVTFGRLEKPVDEGLRSFVEPDRLHLFDRLPNGLYRRNDVEYVRPSR